MDSRNFNFTSKHYKISRTGMNGSDYKHGSGSRSMQRRGQLLGNFVLVGGRSEEKG
jgi:hypothetical protein